MDTASKRTSLEQFYARKDETALPANPNDNYWRLGVQALQQQLAELIGKDAYREFAEMVWPGNTIDPLTYLQIYNQLDAALILAWDQERDLDKLAQEAENVMQAQP